MQPFLQLVAHDLYTKIGNDLSRTVLVFPNNALTCFLTNTWQKNPTNLSGRLPP